MCAFRQIRQDKYLHEKFLIIFNSTNNNVRINSGKFYQFIMSLEIITIIRNKFQMIYRSIFLSIIIRNNFKYIDRYSFRSIRVYF